MAYARELKTLSSLLKAEFVKTVRQVENEDASGYRTFRLKERLKDRFPQLVFHTPKVRHTYVKEVLRRRYKCLTNEQSDVETEDELVGEEYGSVMESDFEYH